MGTMLRIYVRCVMQECWHLPNSTADHLHLTSVHSSNYPSDYESRTHAQKKKEFYLSFDCFLINPKNWVRSTPDIKIHSEICNLYPCNYQVIPWLYGFLLICGFQSERDLLPWFLLVIVLMGLVHAGFRGQWNIHSVLGLLCCLSASECLMTL